MKTCKWILFTLIIIVIQVTNSSYLFSENTIRQITTFEGLSNNSVNCIFQDSDGLMWFGTWDGLNSYNGRDITIYKYDNTKNSISNNIIRQIAEQDSLHLWIATDDGINLLNKKTQKINQYLTNLSQTQKAFTIGTTASKNLICYLRNEGWFYYNKELDKFERYRNLTQNKPIKNFIIDNNNQIFVLFENGELERYKISEDNNTIAFEDKYSIEKNCEVLNLFFTNGYLILRYKSDIKIIDKQNKYPSTVEINSTKTVSQVSYFNNRFLIAYSEGGCDTYNTETKILETLENLPRNLYILSMIKGTQDILWIGTDGQGVWQMYDYNSAFNLVKTFHPVRTFCEIQDNKILIGTKGEGIKVFDKKNKSLKPYANIDEGITSNSVYIIKKNKSGDIFIGTEGIGLNYISDNKVQTLHLPQSPIFKSVYSISFTNNDSTIWVGTSGYGFIKINVEKENGIYSVKKIKQFSTSNNPVTAKNDIIYGISQGLNPKELWIATRNGGIFQFNTETEKFKSLESINKDHKISSSDVLCLRSIDGSLWAGTSFGLDKINLDNPATSNITSYTEKQGLTNNTIHGILYDNNNDLWVSTNGGLSHLNFTNNSVSNYTAMDGLQNNEFSDGAYYTDSDGIFYFGGVNGFNYFRPNDIYRRDFNARVILSNLKILNTQLNIHERISDNRLHLAYDEAYTTLTFLSEDYINNENCEYSYRLLNFSDEWFNNGKNPTIVLTKLPPGSYELQVKATNGDRVWSNHVYTLRIDVAYPWWLSSIAISIYIVIFIFIIYTSITIIRNRIKLNRQILLDQIEKENQRKIHESKLNFFTNVAHEFFTPLSLIYGPAQHLLEKDDLDNYTKRYVQIIKNNADRMQKLISELMDFRKVESGHVPLHPENIDLMLLINYITDNYSEIAEENKIDFTIDTDNISNLITDRSSLEKIVFNLISNAFKYTPENGFIRVHAQQKDNKFFLTVRNSGRGLTKKQMQEIFDQFKIFDKPVLTNNRSTGIGLSLVKSLTSLLGGKINVDSKINEYVEFSVELPSINNTKNKIILKENESDTVSINTQNLTMEQKDISILLVEDEKNIRELLKDILNPYYMIYEASDGQHALDLINQNTPNIVITDIMMPHIDGLELIERLKSDIKTSHIPIISISAKTSIDDKVEAYKYGADIYLTKPFHPRHVLVTIQNLIKKQNVLKNYFTSGVSALSIKDGIELHKEDESFLNEIINYVEKNMDDETLNPNSIAETMGISKATLYRKLNDLTGKTPSEFVRSIRLNNASLLLRTTKMTVQEIMFKSGFTNKSYFYREFAKQYNSSPNEYRQNKTSQQ